jgi:hypothetical protein
MGRQARIVGLAASQRLFPAQWRRTIRIVDQTDRRGRRAAPPTMSRARLP